jgi:hypothetical protein
MAVEGIRQLKAAAGRKGHSQAWELVARIQ